ncbi:hypothetical protein [Polluticaenibacter yanchengensis]|uniref:Uncharacterized protein n=1 Tax=Polluticaenibacter yanchengensis TaxID=3014562 RepID=A0ABT4UJ83_9BACT|nr:hypothetical protein [Chitinophagaceae bacterium LY-5]
MKNILLIICSIFLVFTAGATDTATIRAKAKKEVLDSIARAEKNKKEIRGMSAAMIYENKLLIGNKMYTLYDNKTWTVQEITAEPLEYEPSSSYGSGSGAKTNYKSSGSSSSTTVSTTCGAKNKTGGFCKRKVSGGGRCWQHG